MFSLIELKTAVLDAGTPGISPWHAVLLLMMVVVIPIIPYILLSHSLEEQEDREALVAPPSAPEPFVKMTARMHAWLHSHHWMHSHHPHLLHH